jgi:hypothetical protein
MRVAAMSTDTITLTPAQRTEALDAALTLYSVKAEALHHDVNEYLEDRDGAEAITRHRDEIASLERILDQLGWDLTTNHPAQLSLAEDRTILFDILHGAYTQAVERIAETIGDAPAMTLPLGQIRQHLRRADSLVELLEAVKAAERPRRGRRQEGERS